jgi:hypothetical protein
MIVDFVPMCFENLQNLPLHGAFRPGELGKSELRRKCVDAVLNSGFIFAAKPRPQSRKTSHDRTVALALRRCAFLHSPLYPRIYKYLYVRLRASACVCVSVSMFPQICRKLVTYTSLPFCSTRKRYLDFVYFDIMDLAAFVWRSQMLTVFLTTLKYTEKCWDPLICKVPTN